MDITLGATVHSSDGADLGIVRAIILSPASRQGESVVIEKGFLFHHDVELPLSMLVPTGPASVSARITAEQFRQMPEFDESRYEPAPADMLEQTAAFPAGAMLWPTSTSGFPAMQTSGLAGALLYPLTTETAGAEIEDSDVPPDSRHDTVVREGCDVIASDGVKVGEMHQMSVDPATGLPHVLSVRRGYFFVKESEIPGDRIERVEDGVIYLNVPGSEVRQWTENAVETLI